MERRYFHHGQFYETKHLVGVQLEMGVATAAAAVLLS